MPNFTKQTAFASDVYDGLSASCKSLPSKYFYDARGSQLFQEIMAMAEYYPTSCEKEILENKSDELLDLINFEEPFDIVEFGSGDGSKTISLLKTFTAHGRKFTYIPIDISQDVLEDLKQNVHSVLPDLPIEPLVGDYSEISKKASHKPALLLFLGGNIGNYPRTEAIDLLQSFAKNMRAGDKIVVGMDLRKDPHVIKLAYDDPHGITRDFNMNLLTRINRELEANIDLDKFGFYCHYDPISGGVRSYLYSKFEQQITSVVLDSTFTFSKNELIWTELSQKFSFDEIDDLAEAAGFKVLKNITDSKQYFKDSVWVK